MTPNFITGVAALVVGWTIFSIVINTSIMIFMEPGDLMYGSKRSMVEKTKGKKGAMRALKAIAFLAVLATVFYFTGLQEASIATLGYAVVYVLFFVWKRKTAVNNAG